jgi:zinc finger protein
MTMLSISTEIPYFGEHTQISLVCDSCGWRQTDFIPAEGRKPGAWSLVLDSREKMRSRVVRSPSCTIRLVELDLEVTPGSASSGFISNIEGVVKRFEDAIGTLLRHSQAEQNVEAADGALELLEHLSNVKLGMRTVEMVLFDPNGRSQILHDDAVSRDLTGEELGALQSGVDIPIHEIQD